VRGTVARSATATNCTPQAAGNLPNKIKMLYDRRYSFGTALSSLRVYSCCGFS
jgi:hypothetical protein